MRQEAVKHIVRYYGSIPDALKMLKRERAELEDEYNGLGGLGMDGMPHSATPGDQTAALAARVVENGTRNRLREVCVQIDVLEQDAETIRGCLDAVNGRYKAVLVMRYVAKYSWGQIAAKMRVPNSTVRNWHDKGAERLGEALDEVPMADELAHRASRART